MDSNSGPLNLCQKQNFSTFSEKPLIHFTLLAPHNINEKGTRITFRIRNYRANIWCNILFTSLNPSRIIMYFKSLAKIIQSCFQDKY